MIGYLGARKANILLAQIFIKTADGRADTFTQVQIYFSHFRTKYFSALSKCEEILKTKSDSSVSGQNMDWGFVVGDIKGREIQEDVTRIDGAIYSNIAGILNIHWVTTHIEIKANFSSQQ